MTKQTTLAVTQAQIDRAKILWKNFEATSKAFMTANEKKALEAEQAKSFFGAYLAECGDNQELALKTAMQALKQVAPKNLSAAQIAMLPDTESLEDAALRNAARIRKVLERFKNLMLTGERQSNADKKANQKRKGKAVEAIAPSGGVIPSPVIDATLAASNAPIAVYKNKTMEEVLLSCLRTIEHELNALKIANRPIEPTNAGFQYALALTTFTHKCVKGEVMPLDADAQRSIIATKFGR